MKTQLRITTDVKKPHVAADVRLDTQAIKPDCPFYRQGIQYNGWGFLFQWVYGRGQKEGHINH
ncbi:MAG: hypothetical protein HamCj_19970 [Candidatus Hamiltonella defensa (Ceratovacuna japonica)]